MLERGDLSDIIGLVYDAALDQAAWPTLLGRLAGLFNSHFADSFRRTQDYSAFGGVPFGLDIADYDDVFLGFWVKRNVWGTRRPVVRAGDVVSTRQMTPVADLLRSEMYNEYLAARGLHEGLRLDIWAGEGWIEDISLLRPWSAGAFTDGEIGLARDLMPHLQRAAEMSRRLRRAEALAECGLAALEQVATAFLLLDRFGRLIHANASACSLLAEQDGLSVTAAGLAAATQPITSRLRALVDGACGRPADKAVAGAIRLSRPSGRPPLALVALPLRQGQSLPGPGWGDVPSVLVCVTDPASGARPPQAQLIALFGLTQAEAALAGDLLDGHELRDIAQASGRSINTVRSQLATLMAKTDTGRQSELVRLLARLPGSAGHAGDKAVHA